MDLKKCPKCKEVKQLSEFSAPDKWNGSVVGRCKACLRAYHNAWYAKNKPRRKAQRDSPEAPRRPKKAPTLKGVAGEQRKEMLTAQANLCAICFRDMWQPHLDHDHKTGRLRRFLCGPCNTGIGLLQDDVDVLKRAVTYLDYFS